jgi:hypothetical protein
MLMILITLSLAAILVAWAGTSFGAFSGGSSLYFAQRGQAMQERFVIENAFFLKTGTPPNTLLIFVRNVGSIEVNITAIYVNGTSLGGSLQSTPTSTPPLCATLRLGSNTPNLPVQTVCEFSLLVTPGNSVVRGGAICGSTWCPNSIFYILVASNRGNQAVYTARGP